MINVCVLTHSPVYRAGITALLREGTGSSDVRIIELDEGFSDVSNVVYILFQDEFDKFREQTAGRNVVVVVNQPEQKGWLFRGHDAGWGLVPYDASAEDLIACAAAVDRGMVVLSAAEFNRLAAPDAGGDAPPQDDDMVERLTNREMDILQLLGQGYQNKQIALALGISENTVKFHVSAIFSKLGVSNRTEALKVGNKHGLISI